MEGGPGTLEAAYKSVQGETPIIVWKGTERVADALALAYEKVTQAQKQSNAYHAFILN